MNLTPWMVACFGIVVTLLALVLQEKLTSSQTTLGEYIKACGFNGLLSYAIALLMLRWNSCSSLSAMKGGAVHLPSASMPADILSGPPHF